MKVRNMTSPSSGREVANQYIIDGDDGSETFQSYNSIIARIDKDGTTLDEYYWDYSTTTGKYRNIFLREKKAETQKKIDNGTYKLDNLN